MAFASFDDYWQPFLRGQGPAGAYVASLAESGAAGVCEQAARPADEHAPDAGFTLEARAWAVRGVVT